MSYHKKHKMYIDTQKPYFKYSIKTRLLDRGIEINALFLHLVNVGFDINIGTLSRYLNHKYDSDGSIPSDILKEIAVFLNTTMESLFNECD